MRHKGRGLCDYSEERDRELLLAWRGVAGGRESLSSAEICRRVVACPTRRFWVSEERAAAVLSSVLRGGSLDGLRPERQAMFAELLRRVEPLLASGLPIREAAARAVHSRAPRFFLTPKTAMVLLCRIRKRWKETVLRAVRR